MARWVVCLILPLLGCGSDHVTLNELLGNYQSEHRDGKETLALHEDQTYRQLYNKSNGIALTNSGTWKFFPPRPGDVRGGVVLLNDAWLVDRMSDTLATNKGSIGLNVFAGRWMIQLQVGEDGAISYDKNRQEAQPK